MTKNSMLPLEGNRAGQLRRSSPVPVVNPSWSQKTIGEIELIAARPAGLPSTPLDELDGMEETSSERRTPELQLPVSWAKEGGGRREGLRDCFPRWLRAGLREVPGGSQGLGAPEGRDEGPRTMGRMPESPMRMDGQVRQP